MSLARTAQRAFGLLRPAAGAAQARGFAFADTAACTGQPMETYDRKAMIYSPARQACQQGLGFVGLWKVALDNRAKWENPLMGWTTTADPMENVLRAEGMVFDTKEAAMAFCDKHGWAYDVTEPKEMVTGRNPKNYSDNFSHKWKGIPGEPQMYNKGPPGPYRPVDAKF